MDVVVGSIPVAFMSSTNPTPKAYARVLEGAHPCNLDEIVGREQFFGSHRGSNATERRGIGGDRVGVHAERVAHGRARGHLVAQAQPGSLLNCAQE